LSRGDAPTSGPPCTPLPESRVSRSVWPDSPPGGGHQHPRAGERDERGGGRTTSAGPESAPCAGVGSSVSWWPIKPGVARAIAGSEPPGAHGGGRAAAANAFPWSPGSAHLPWAHGPNVQSTVQRIWARARQNHTPILQIDSQKVRARRGTARGGGQRAAKIRRYSRTSTTRATKGAVGSTQTGWTFARFSRCSGTPHCADATPSGQPASVISPCR